MSGRDELAAPPDIGAAPLLMVCSSLGFQRLFYIKRLLFPFSFTFYLYVIGTLNLQNLIH